MTRSVLIRVFIFVPILLWALPIRPSVPAAQADSNPIVLENQQPGTTSWRIDTDSSGTPLMATNHQIEGYASATSVNVGEQISFMVNLSSSALYSMQIYRMGYYGGTGGRLMQTVSQIQGSSQPACPTTTTTTNFGLIECHWAAAYTLTVPTTWTTGAYLVKLTRADNGLESYMTFVVRNDSAPADIVLSEDVTTWQAYNFWGGSGNNDIGYSLYARFNDVSFTSTSQRASAVSFDRPYLVQGETDGAGQLFIWDYPMIRWLESQGYNVTYATDTDINSNPNLLTGRKALINTGHDEYYSDNMRSNLQNYINGGAHVGFFSANNVYYRIRFASDSSGQSDRTEICYKATTDPQSPPTIRWRDLSPPQPENSIVGIMQNGTANDRPYEVYNASSWIYSGTGLTNYTGATPATSGPNQNAIAGIVGYEFDESAANDSSLSQFVANAPAGLQQVGHSNVPAIDNGVAAFSDATLYTAASGAIVFAAGTLQWSWGLDNGYNSGFCDCNPGYTNSKSQQITTNILTRFLNTASTPPAVSISPTSLTFASQAVNSTSPAQSVTLTNTGGAPLTISSIGISGTNAGDFSQTNTCPTGSTTLAINASCTISVTFTPTASGSRTASVSLTDDAAGSPQSVPLSGTGASSPIVSFSPSTLTFTNQQINTTSPSQSVTLTNTGSAPLTISSIGFSGANSGDFTSTTTCAFSPNTLQAGGSCTINVSFAPTASGSRTASLSVADDASGSPQTVALSGTGTSTPVPAVGLNPTSLTFATQAINTTSPAQTVTVTNTGNASLQITSISLTGTNAADFSQTNTCPTGAATLDTGATCTISATFAPSQSGSETASVSLVDNASDSPHSVSLTGTGSLTAGTYLVDGFESGNLGLWSTTNSAGGSESIQTTRTNSGTYAAALANSSNADFSNLFTGLAGGGQGLTYTRFCFDLSGISGSDILAQARDVNGNNVWEIDYDAGLKGLDFYLWNGSRARTDLTSPGGIVLANTWYCAEIQLNETSSGHGELWLNGTSVAKVDTDLSVTNAYSQLRLWNNGAAGTVYYDDVKVASTYNGPVGAGSAPLPAPAVSLTPTSLSFANQVVNTSSGTQTITLTNTGTAPLAISSIGTTGTNASDFGQANTCPLTPSTVPAGGTCTINVTFRPTVTGTRTANLSITDNAPGSPQNDALSGTAIPPPAPAVSLSPTNLAFTGQQVNTASSSQSVTLTNSGTDPLIISSIGISGTNGADYSQTSTCPTGSTTLAVAASCSIAVTFMPAATGNRTANVTITDNAADSPQTLPLSGTGTLPNGIFLMDDFENGLRIWNPAGNGVEVDQSTVVNSGNNAASLTNASSQFAGLSAGLAGGGQALTYSRFCFNLSGISASTVLAQGRDVNGNPMWEVDYDAGLKGLDLYLWNGTRTRSDLASPANAVAANTWYCAEVELNEASSGHAELWLNGTSVARADTDLSATNNFSQMFLWNNASIGTVYMDDVKVANTYNGPVGAGTSGPAVRLNPTSVNFGNQVVSSTSSPQSVTLTDNGIAPLDISNIAITGTNANDFAQTNNCPASLGGGANCTINLTFTPGGTDARSASLAVTDSASDSPQSVALSGTGVNAAPQVGLNPSSVAFGNQLINTSSGAQSVTLTNTGNSPLTISGIGLTGTNTGDFIQTNTCPSSPNTLAAGANCTVSVTFSPTATGARTAALSITDDASGSPQSVSLTGTGTAPAVSLSPSSLAFGNQTTGTTSTSRSITLTNSGTGPLSISGIAIAGTNPGDFAQTNTCPATPSTLAAGGTCSVSVTFTPSTGGSRSASLSLTDSASDSPQSVALGGTGVNPAPVVSLSPTSLTFGNRNVNTTSPSQSVTLTNSGNAPLSISSISVAGTNASDFSQTNTCPSGANSLAAGSTCTISVTFTPAGTGSRSGTISITDNAIGSPQSVVLSGTGTTPAVSLTPASLTFGSQLVNTSSGGQSVTLTNSGTGPLTISSIGLSGANPGDFSQTNTCPGSTSSLAAGASCTITASFKPAATGARSATISISDNAASSPQSVALTGTGVTPAVTASPTSLTFASQSVNTTSPSQTVTVKNTGTAALTITGIGISGTNASNFAQTNTCPISPSTLAVNAQCTVTVTFTPSASGARSANLSFTDNAGGSPQTVAMTGTGTLAAVTLSTTSLSFGTTTVGQTMTKSVTLTNSGTAALLISSIGISGTNPGDYSQTNNCPTAPNTLAAKAKCTINVTFKPTAKGTRTATLSISDSASGAPHTVALSGSGK